MNPNEVTEAVTAEQTAELPVLPIRFVPADLYTTFRAEFAIEEGDIIFHFYVTDAINKLPNPWKYWLELFPKCLSDNAERYFNTVFPRLKAAYTEEKGSWWMRAFGFGKLLDPHRFAHRFLDLLDEALDSEMSKAM